MRGLIGLTTLGLAAAAAVQAPFRSEMAVESVVDSPAAPVPRVMFHAGGHEGDDDEIDPRDMTLIPIALHGKPGKMVNLMIFGDGYTDSKEDLEKYKRDASKLADDIVGEHGAMAHVRDLVNVWGVYVAGNQSGLGIDAPLPGAPFGLYRSGRELRAVYPGYPKRARAACAYWRKHKGACDQPILMGNDGLYGGLGGEFTIITASEKNGPVVLRHELGHSLIPVGEEYEGGFVYSGANADKVSHLHDLKWKSFLTRPKDVRIEDAKVPLQDYAWHDLDESDYAIDFIANGREGGYATALLRASMSSIPDPSHVSLQLNGKEVDLASAFPDDWAGSLDRRWLEVHLDGVQAGQSTLQVSLTDEGRRAKAGQGGKLICSAELIEYGGDGRFNATMGFIGAFPTYNDKGGVTLRPTNEECLMRRVNHPSFCPVCKHALKKSLQKKIKQKRRAIV